jgi:hypothetical protein
LDRALWLTKLQHQSLLGLIDSEGRIKKGETGKKQDSD